MIESAAPARLIAFYLPQFHPIPENDAWWGRGFTEWTNVVRAAPLFPGHYQPHLPADLGFYDLRLPEARQAQADLAREYGIHGFCYYHYWFNGKLLLERPLEGVLNSGEPDFPFCICWANENWTRAWDGLDREMLTKQRYSAEDDLTHIRWMARALLDPRYIRVDGKPLVLIYRVSQLPSPTRTADIWRSEARSLGIGELFLASVDSLRDDRLDPTRQGFDATVEFQPDWLNLGGAAERRTADGTDIYDYARVAERMRLKPEPTHRAFKCVVSGWDNTPRRKRSGVVLADSTPELYQHWLEHALQASRPTAGGHRIVFINAWNEWAEGAHLEPCQKWGRAYLEATRAALVRTKPLILSPPPAITLEEAARQRRLTVCIPTYNGSRYLSESISSVLAQSFSDFELLIVDDGSTDATREVAQRFNDPRIRCVWGDIRLGLVGNWNRALALCRSEYVCLFHQDDVMAPDNLRQKVAFLDEHPTAGIVHSNVAQIGPAGETLSEWWYFKPDPADAGLQRGLDFFSRLIGGPNIVCCPSVVLRASCVTELGAFDPALPFTTDLEMWLRIALFHDVGYLVEPLVKYRRHAANETNNFLAVKELEHRYAAKRLVLRKYPTHVQDLEALEPQLVEQYIGLALQRAAECFRQQQSEEARQYLAMAVELHGDSKGESAAAAYRDWLLQILEKIHTLQPDIQLPPAQPAGAQNLELALEQALREVTALRSSISWKVTKPLRRVYDAVRRPSGAKR